MMEITLIDEKCGENDYFCNKMEIYRAFSKFVLYFKEMKLLCRTLWDLFILFVYLL